MIIIIYIVLHILFYKIYTIYSDLSLLRPYTSNVLFWLKNKTKQKTKAKFFHECSCKNPKQENASEVYSRNARLAKHWNLSQHHPYQIKEKNLMINSINTGKSFDKIEASFIKKALR